MCHETSCGHGHHGHHGMRQHQHHSGGCCCTHGHGMRRFPTREEILTELEEYLKQLQTETKGVEEQIAEFRKTG